MKCGLGCKMVVGQKDLRSPSRVPRCCPLAMRETSLLLKPRLKDIFSLNIFVLFYRVSISFLLSSLEF
jgi:hypothetical protein